MKTIDNLKYDFVNPEQNLVDFVDSFWMIENTSDSAKPTIGLPDGRVDLFLSKSSNEPFHITLLGVGTQHYEKAVIPANCVIFAISFKLLAVEYIIGETVADVLNNGKYLPADFWAFNENDLQNFTLFCQKASQKIQSLLPKEIDKRKQKLMELIYTSKGEQTVKELSEQVFWSSRQINRYFNQQFGLSLKAYCSVLRFRASLSHIAQGKLSPELNFTDQTHFIKEIKKFSGVVPKELFKNENDRFILLSTLVPK